ncbi:MAG: FtsQ-type POTRA domain-containing protein, partial [Alphaproteobacteria bacterium]|nr:FtsQ-type POTRA domain-containing protein [Alphaproteobacteria bacterium]
AQGRAAPRRTTRRGKAGGGFLGGVVTTLGRRITDLRRDAHRLGPILLFAGLSAVTIGSVWLVASGTAASALAFVDTRLQAGLVEAGLSLQRITIRGRTNVESDEIIEALQLDLGQSILHVDLEAARARVEAIDWVESATVMRMLPGTIHIELHERRPFAIWRTREGDALIDRAGTVITRHDVTQFAGLPFVVGPGAERTAGELIEILDRQPLLKARVVAAVRMGGRRWDLRLDNGITVRLPDSGVEEAIRELVELNAQHDILGRSIRSIDLRFPDRWIIDPGKDGDGPSEQQGEGGEILTDFVTGNEVTL